VDSATAASQNGFCSYWLSPEKKATIILNMTKTLQFLLLSAFIKEQLLRKIVI
jgi:hypothetical protein